VISYGDIEEYYPVRILMTVEVAALMQSNEGKHHLKLINKHSARLKKFIDDNTQGEGCARLHHSVGG